MKKTVLTPPTIAVNGDMDYADKIMALPREKRVHRSLFYGMTAAACVALIALSAFVVAVYRPLTPKSVTPWHDLPVGEELFEKLIEDPWMVTTTCGLVADDEKTIYDIADIVVVGYPVNTFTDDSIVYFDKEGNAVGPDGAWYTPDTVRDIKVLEVIKGDNDLETVGQRVSAITQRDSDGNMSIAEYDFSYDIQKQNVKYIYYFIEWGNIDGAPLYSAYEAINIDGLDTDGIHVRPSVMYDVMEKYGDLFEKYDRTGVEKYTPTDSAPENLEVTGEVYSKFNWMNRTGYTELQNRELADLIIVGSPTDTLHEGEMVGDRTLRNIQVHEVIKGECDDTVTLSHRGVIVPAELAGGMEYLISSSEPVQTKNVKYLYYLKKSDDGYRLVSDTAVVNVDGLEPELENYTQTLSVYTMCMKYGQLFKKYERGTENGWHQITDK